MPQVLNHEIFMQRCLQLAASGLGRVAPNPLVGAVLVNKGKIIGEGYHQIYGGPHAEVVALQGIDDPLLLKNSTLYVNLEPCSHFGKTPPCADLIVSKGIKEVVIANRDPFAEVNGRGIKILKKAGVKVTTGVLEKEGAVLNKRFFSFHEKKRPYIILKWAQSADGFLAPEKKKKNSRYATVSGEMSRTLVHQWRSEEAAILIGSGTLLADNPLLDARMINGSNPQKIIIGTDGSIPANKNIFKQPPLPVLVYNALKAQTGSRAVYIKIPRTKNALPAILSDLHNRSVQSVLVEGGAVTLQRFIDSGLWDEARVFTSPIEFYNGTAAPQLKKSWMQCESYIESDRLTIYRNQLT